MQSLEESHHFIESPSFADSQQVQTPRVAHEAALIAEANQIAVDQRNINDRKRAFYRKARQIKYPETELKVRIYGESARSWGDKK